MKVATPVTAVPMTKWHERAKIIVEERAKTTPGFQAALARKMETNEVNISRVLNGKTLVGP